MLSLHIGLISILLRLSDGSVSSSTVLPQIHHPKLKRDVTSFPYVTLGPPLLPSLKKSQVISDVTPSINLKFNTNTNKSNGRLYGGPIQSFGLQFDPSNFKIKLTDKSSIALPNNQIPNKTHLPSSPLNQRPSEGKSVIHLNFPKQKHLFDSLSGYPVFYGEPLLPVATQTIKNPIYNVRNQETKGSKTIENGSRATYQTMPNQIFAYPYFPFSPEFAEQDSPRVLMAGNSAKLQAEPFDFPSYDIPNVGTTSAFQVLPNAVSQGQSATGVPQFALYQRGFFVPEKKNIHSIEKLAREGYQALTDQPHLHFGHSNAWQPPVKDNKMHYMKAAEKIRTDVEVVDKKKPAPTEPTPDDDSEEDDSEEEDEDNDPGYKFTTREYSGNSNDEDDYSEKFGGESDGEKTYKNLYGLQLYDEKFGKYSKKPDVNNKKSKESSPLSGFSFNSDNDEDSDEYISKFYDDYSMKQGDDDRSAESTKMKKKQKLHGDDDYRMATYSTYETHEEELDKNYRPLAMKNSTPKKVAASSGGVQKNGKSEVHSLDNRGNGKVAEYSRNNYQQKPGWYGAQFPSHEFTDPSTNKKQASISYKRNVELNNSNKNNVSGAVDVNSFRYKFPKAKTTLKPINHQDDREIRTNSQSSDTQNLSVSPFFHKSHVPENENEPLQEVRNSYSVAAENKWLLNKRSQDKTDNRGAPRLKAFSDVYVSSNPSFFATKDSDHRSLAGI